MAQQKRQSNLYAAEDWKLVYESFYKINLTAYDFDTIRESMVRYLRLQYSDQFNDWIENDEFIFILDTISLLGQNLAFRMDLNTRENFLDTAERRSSVLKLAKMISYSPKRAYPGRALAKITEIKTNQDVLNSFNQSLKGRTILWNDPADPNWYENFILVMNSSFISTNQFGNPVKKVQVNGINQQLYRMNTLPMSAPNMPFSANINGESVTFEVVNPDITSTGAVERMPEPQDQKYMIYCNDGNGFSSPDTGFFVYFKQGSLSYSDYQYDVRIENRLQEINVSNVNQLDVWVQEINSDGLVVTKWTQVPSLESIAYNSVSRQQKNIYSVITRDQDQITIKYPDSRSGMVPRGTYRVWYRVSNGKTYTIKTSSIQSKSVKYVYRTNKQTVYENSSLDIKFSLQRESRLAQSAETIQQIKDRAPQMYYTQDRFVTGEDYNIAPLMLGNTVIKSKALNRIYSGMSRFIDINDPTGKYQNTDVFNDDGALYKENVNKSNSLLLPTPKSNDSIVIDNIQPLIGENSVIQYYQEWDANEVPVTFNQTWTPIHDSRYPSNTYGQLIQNGQPILTYKVGTLLRMVNASGQAMWTSILSVLDNGFYALSSAVDPGRTVGSFIKPYRVKFTTAEVQVIAAVVDKKTNFVLIYDTSVEQWVPIEGTYTSDTIVYKGITYPVLINVQYTAESWEFVSNGVEYIFVGGDKVKFYFVSPKKITDISTGTVQADKISVLNNNPTFNSNLGYTNDVNFQIYDTIQQENGYLDGSRVIITSQNVDSNGIPLDPNLYEDLVPNLAGEDLRKYGGLLFFRQNDDFTITSVNVNNDFTLMDSTWTYTLSDANNEVNAYRKKELTRNILIRSTTMSDLYNKGSGFTIGYQFDGQYYFVEQTVGNNNERLDSFLVNMTLPSDTTAITPEIAFRRATLNEGQEGIATQNMLSYYGYKDVSTEYTVQTGARTGVNYQWKHYAPDDNRIDPSRTNLIDMYVLTTNYYEDVNVWIKNGANGEFPQPPTSVELQNLFKDVETKMVISDSAIWHSAEFLKLFGQSADEDYQADLKIVKLPNSSLSNDEIRQKVVELTQTYFDVQNWDFGETFYFTELSTFIQVSMATDVAAVVIVPQNPNSKFGELFEIPCRPDQLFVSTATVDNVQIVSSLAKSNINIGN